MEWQEGSELSSTQTSNSHNASLTIREGAHSSRWDPSVDALEAPGLVEALLTLQPRLNGIQREEGQIHAHSGTASSL